MSNSATANQPHLVICANHTVRCGSYAAAVRQLEAIEDLGACGLPHEIKPADASNTRRNGERRQR